MYTLDEHTTSFESKKRVFRSINKMENDAIRTIDGISINTTMFSEDSVRSGLVYQARPDDIFIVSWPKSGTTWMEVIIYTLLHPTGPSFDENFEDYLLRTTMLELQGADATTNMPRPGTIKTHLPFNRVPKHPQAKYICLIRNPKDACVSRYYFHKTMPAYGTSDKSFDDYFETFMKGQQGFGSYFDWILQMWEHKDDENVLLFSYESMKKDVYSVIRQVASLLNITLTDDLLERAVKFSSFEYMKENYDSQRKKTEINMSSRMPSVSNERVCIRKGCVGDWKTIMSEEQSRRIDEQFAATTLNHPDLRRFLDGNINHNSESEQ